LPSLPEDLSKDCDQDGDEFCDFGWGHQEFSFLNPSSPELPAGASGPDVVSLMRRGINKGFLPLLIREVSLQHFLFPSFVFPDHLPPVSHELDSVQGYNNEERESQADRDEDQFHGVAPS
jgi:hypothetical protein